MNAVERLSTYITRGVYTVSGPFHPFGGAVDIIVVQQPDGSFKSSPWYVRFGKFQGVLKTKEKVVNIRVNGTAAGFHMYLDNKGEAYFVKDSEKQEGEFIASPTSSSDEADEKTKNGRFKKTQNLNFDGSRKDPDVQMDKGNGKIVSRTAPKHARILGLMFGRKSIKEDDQGANVQRVSSLERAEIAADLLDLKWSTNLSTENMRVDNSLVSAKPSQSDYADVVDNEKQIETSSSEDDLSQVERINSQVESVGDNFETSVFKSEHSQQIGFCDSTRQSFEDEGLKAHRVENVGALFDRSNLVANQVILGSDELAATLKDSTLKGPTMVTQSPVILDAAVESIDSGDKGSHVDPVTKFESRESTKAITADNQSLRAHEEVVEFYSLGACEIADNGRVATETIQTKVDLSVENEETEITSLSYCETLESTTRRYNEPFCYNGEQSEFHTEHTSKTNELFSEVMQPQSGMLMHKEDSTKFSHDNREATCLENSLNSGTKLESICTSTSCSIYNIQEENFEENFEVATSGIPIGVNTNQGLNLSIQTAAFGAAVPAYESLEADQFSFSDSDSSVTKASNIELPPDGLPIKTEDDSVITVEDNAESADLALVQSPEKLLEVLRTQSSAIDIPKSRTKFEETKLLTRSLPSIYSHIHEFENPNLIHSISCSTKSEPCNIDFLNKDCPSSTKLEPSLKSNKLRSQSIPANLDSIADYEEAQQKALAVSPAIELSLNKHLLYSGMGVEAASEAFNSAKELKFEHQGMIAVDRAEKNPNIDTTGGSWRLWPFNFKKSKSIQTVRSAPEGIILTTAAPTEGSRNLNGDNDVNKSKVLTKKVRSFAPSSDEIASLNLKEGRNVVTFSFSTAMLGQQQVDARIYLWKWNTRIVVSDVDGTITKSDVLGQFMPLVGVDWTQTGVTHLFSAIKENGYQLLFLSARAISQAYLTRQFLFNLKQDGKALPDGPVVISPDGLFPSLYREVIRRAPHEFKISCLEDIKALFPPDCNPFYAGFGNRDTDEISYLKVGIPKGKIFIINPKGEVAVNRRVDTKSYTSLHVLVNGVFPAEPSAEWEEYNSWNFWKLPLPDVV